MTATTTLGRAARRVTAAAAVLALAIAPAAARAAAHGPEDPGGGGAASDLTALVDPFVGTAGGGNTFPGATVPFGMVQLSPDTGYAEGYSYTGTAIRGFSHTHLSGAGCGAYGDIPLMPTVGAVTSTNPASYASSFDHAHEHAAPGRYEVDLKRYGVHAELTAAQRTGLHRYTFPATDQANVLINVGQNLGPQYDASVRIVGDDTVQGWVRSGSFCGQRNRYTVYFSARFDRPFRSFGTWKGSTLSPGRSAQQDRDAGAWVTFDARTRRTVEAQVGISYVSIGGAEANRVADTRGQTFDDVRDAAHDKWDEMLHRIEIDGGTSENRQSFYTALYHALIAPTVFSDADGAYRGFDGEVHTASGRLQYANYSLWDTYRTEHELLALVAPERARDMAASLLADEREGGWLPKWPVANDESNVMTGDPATPVLVDAYMKGLLSGMEDEAYAALWKDANGVPGPELPFEGRWGNTAYIADGYVPYMPGAPDKGSTVDPTMGGSITLEYALADSVLAEMAQRLHHGHDARILRERGHNYMNVFDRGTGLPRPRLADGTWMSPFNPTAVTGFNEGTASQYRWLVPQDPEGLFKLLGGDAAALDRLDAFFAYDDIDPAAPAPPARWCKPPVNACASAYYNPNNEPNLHAPYMYLWTSRPDRTATVVRAAQALFHSGPNGITGNDDLGTMSAWYVFSSLGLYPVVPGAPTYALTSPLFEHAVVHLRHPYYRASNLMIDAPGASPQRRYITAATLNGRPFERSWLSHRAIRSGAVLHYDLSDAPARRDGHVWASGQAARPPAALRPAPPQRHLQVAAPPITYAAAGRETTLHLTATVTASAPDAAGGTVSVDVPEGWSVEPSSRDFALDGDRTPETHTASFDVTVPATATAGDRTLGLTATAGGMRAEATATVRVVDAGCAFTSDGWCAAKLDAFLNHDGISTHAHPGDGTFDGSGWSYAAEVMPAPGPVTMLGTPFEFPDSADGANNSIAASGQTVLLPEGRFDGARMIGASHHGAADPAVATLNYSDGSTDTVSIAFSDWAQPPGAGQQIAWTADHRHYRSTGDVGPTVFLFGRSLAVDPSRTLESITLPNNPRLNVFAVSLHAAG